MFDADGFNELNDEQKRYLLNKQYIHTFDILTLENMITNKKEKWENKELALLEIRNRLKKYKSSFYR